MPLRGDDGGGALVESVAEIEQTFEEVLELPDVVGAAVGELLEKFDDGGEGSSSAPRKVPTPKDDGYESGALESPKPKNRERERERVGGGTGCLHLQVLKPSPPWVLKRCD